MSLSESVFVCGVLSIIISAVMARDCYMRTEGISACVLPACVRLARTKVTDSRVYVKRCEILRVEE